MWNINSHINCSCRRNKADNYTSDECSSSGSEWESFKISSTSTFIESQPEEEYTEVVKLVGMFKKLSLYDSDESSQQQLLDRVEPMPQDITLSYLLGNPEKEEEEEDTLEKMVISESNIVMNTVGNSDVLMESLHDRKPDPPNDPAEVIKDGNYFLEMLRNEQKRLLELATVADQYAVALGSGSSPNQWEFALEKLRLFSGSARLLANSKMHQFEDLCLKNLNPLPNNQFIVTCDDLHGFWDMVYQQVPPLNAQFAEILQLRDNNWQAPVAPEAGPGRERMWM